MASPTGPLAASEAESGLVTVGPRTALVIAAPAGAFSAAERADVVNRRVRTILTSPDLDPAQVAVGTLPDGQVAVMLGSLALLTVNPADAAAENTDVTTLAERWARSLGSELRQLKPLYERQGTVDVKTLSEHHVLLLLLQVALLLVAARLGGELASRLGQSPVIGQLLAGVLFGPSVLGRWLPDVKAMVFPVEATQAYLLEVITWLGVLLLLLLAGLESDLAMMKRYGRAALGTAAGGVVLPFLGGLAFGALAPGDLFLLADQRYLVAAYLGVALAVSSVPVIATILMDMGLLRGRVGQVTMAAALAHDTIGWILLALVASLAAGGPFDFGVLLRTVVGTALFGAFMLTIGRGWVGRLLGWVSLKSQAPFALLSTVVILMLASAATTQLIGVHAVLGAFIMGMALRGLPELDEHVVEPIEAITMGVFAPIFFAAAGLNVSLKPLTDPRLIGVTLAFTAAACATKVVGCYLGGRWGRMSHWSALSVGLGANARGAMGLIIGIIGFSLGLLTVDLFSIIVIMAILTTAMTPPLLRWSLGHEPDDEAAEAQAPAGAAALAGAQRLVVCTTRVDGAGGSLAADLAAVLAARSGLLLETAAVPERIDLDDGLALDHWAQQQADDAVLVLPARAWSERTVARLAERRSLPIILVRAGDEEVTWPPRRVLLPIRGQGRGQLATEVSAMVAAEVGAQVTAMHVVPWPRETLFWLPDPEAAEAREEQIAAVVEGVAASHGVHMEFKWQQGGPPGDAIVRAVTTNNVDLVVLRARPHPLDALALGRTTSAVLWRAPCPVVAVVSD